jgi:hypothetical protein
MNYCYNVDFDLNSDDFFIWKCIHRNQIITNAAWLYNRQREQQDNPYKADDLQEGLNKYVSVRSRRSGSRTQQYVLLRMSIIAKNRVFYMIFKKNQKIIVES